MANKQDDKTKQDPREPRIDKSPGKGDFADRTQETTPWEEANTRERHARPKPIVVPETERRSEEKAEEPAKKPAKKTAKKKSSSSKKSK